MRIELTYEQANALKDFFRMSVDRWSSEGSFLDIEGEFTAYDYMGGESAKLPKGYELLEFSREIDGEIKQWWAVVRYIKDIKKSASVIISECLNSKEGVSEHWDSYDWKEMEELAPYLVPFGIELVDKIRGTFKMLKQ